MSVCTCDVRNVRYIFTSTQKNFHEASTACKAKNGKLARFLQRNIYTELNKCCQESSEYWIGLVHNGNCPPKLEDASYQWENTRKCRTAAPLNVIRQSRVSFQCKGIVIRPGSQNPLPMANERNCEQVNRYICQFSLPSTTSSSISTSTKSAAITTTAASIATTTAAAISNKVPNKTALATTKFTKLRTTLTTPNVSTNGFFDLKVEGINDEKSAVNVGVVAGVVMCIMLSLLLLTFLYLWRYKKHNLQNLKCWSFSKKSYSVSSPATTYSNLTQENFYCNVVSSTIPNSDKNLGPSDRPTSYQQLVKNATVTSEYQEINSFFKSETNNRQEKANPQASIEPNGYLYSEIQNDTNSSVETSATVNQIKSSRRKNTTSYKTTVSEIVEYAAVPPHDQPMDIYAVVNKANKNIATMQSAPMQAQPHPIEENDSAKDESRSSVKLLDKPADIYAGIDKSKKSNPNNKI